ncbi:DUF4241 domain-containing protein [Actinoplanes sp. NPDC026623]|uniref:DUF4241 domain-containing protein n=1 Tax=Actinoplanes sp. NPDC026623 TaxID=3155610 RepID=UPI0033C95FDD
MPRLVLRAADGDRLDGGERGGVRGTGQQRHRHPGGEERPERDAERGQAAPQDRPLSSGRVIAADPSSLELDAEPVTVTVPPGTYPVSISLATFTDDSGHSRVCAARLDVGDQPPVRWELALRDGQNTIDLGFGEFFGLGVDAGVACFVDADASDRLKDFWRTFDGLVEPPTSPRSTGNCSAPHVPKPSRVAATSTYCVHSTGLRRPPTPSPVQDLLERFAAAAGGQW